MMFATDAMMFYIVTMWFAGVAMAFALATMRKDRQAKAIVKGSMVFDIHSTAFAYTTAGIAIEETGIVAVPVALAADAFIIAPDAFTL